MQSDTPVSLQSLNTTHPPSRNPTRGKRARRCKAERKKTDPPDFPKSDFLERSVSNTRLPRSAFQSTFHPNPLPPPQSSNKPSPDPTCPMTPKVPHRHQVMQEPKPAADERLWDQQPSHDRGSDGMENSDQHHHGEYHLDLGRSGAANFSLPSYLSTSTRSSGPLP